MLTDVCLDCGEASGVHDGEIHAPQLFSGLLFGSSVRYYEFRDHPGEIGFRQKMLEEEQKIQMMRLRRKYVPGKTARGNCLVRGAGNPGAAIFPAIQGIFDVFQAVRKSAQGKRLESQVPESWTLLNSQEEIHCQEVHFQLFKDHVHRDHKQILPSCTQVALRPSFRSQVPTAPCTSHLC